MRYDLIVVGGGPAGSAAAITAARQRARVLLLERGRLPRNKVCGEFVSPESLSLLRWLMPDAEEGIQDATVIGSVRLFLGSRVVSTKIAPPAASIPRYDLDSSLWTAAEKAGVAARSGVAVHQVSGSAPFIVETAAGDFEAWAVIDATGRWSNLKRPKEAPEAKWIGLKAHFTETHSRSSVDLYFFQGGYCGVQPVQFAGSGAPVLNACAMVRADVARNLPEVFALHPALRERSRGWKQATETVSTSPLVFSEPIPERDGILCAGDAAGFVDPFLGDGISLALHSGMLATECLQNFFAGNRSLAIAVADYRTAYSEWLLPVFRRSARLRRVLALPESVLRWVLPFMGFGSVGQRVMNATRVRPAEAALRT